LVKLQSLDLSDNPISVKNEVYAEKVFDILPNLRVLDGVKRAENKFIGDEEDDEGEEVKMNNKALLLLVSF